MTPQELEKLILLAGDANDQENQWKATHMLTQWLDLSCKIIFPCLIQLLKFSSEESVRFFALTTLQRMDLNPEQRVELRILLMSPINPLSSYLQMKVSVVLARLIKEDFLTSWDSAFDDLFQKTVPTLYLHTLHILFEPGYSSEDPSLRGIKDALRGIPQALDFPSAHIQTKQTISSQIIDKLLILMQRDENNLSFLVLSVLKRMISWIDLSLILNEKVMELLYQSLQKELDASVLAMECFSELIGRGMDTAKKIALIQDIKILESITAHVNMNVLDASPIELVIEVAKFVNNTGLELLPTWENNQLAEALSQKLIDLFFLCFAYDDIDVSGAVIPLANRILERSNSPFQPLLPQFFICMFQQMKYPAGFQFDYEDDDEAEEEVYRTELRKLYQRFVRTNPKICLQFIGEALSNLPLPISTSATSDIEAALRLVYHYCEGVRPSPGLKVVMKNETFCAILVALHQSDISLHEHREVLLLYYDLAVRYAAIFLQKKHLLQKILVPLSGTRGLQHAHPRVRSRSCYLMLKLIKGLAKSMREYVETVVTGIYNLISNPKMYPIDSDDVLYLFETVGILLGKTGLSEEEQKESLTKVMIPHVNKIEKLINSADSNMSLDPDNYGKALSESIAAIAYLSKGFQSPPESVQLVLSETLNISLLAFKVLPSHAILRKNCGIVWQRMAMCLKSKVLQLTPEFLKLMIENCTGEDLVDVSQMINQCLMKFKENSSPFLDALIMPFLQKAFSLIPVYITGEVPPQLKSEQLCIKKYIFSVLHNVVLNGASDLLTSHTNSRNLENILKIMSEGAITTEDPTSKKTCIHFFRLLLEQWSQLIDDKDEIGIFFLNFLYENLIPRLLYIFLKPSFNRKDAMQLRLLREFAQLLLCTRNLRGNNEFKKMILQTTFYNSGCTTEVLEAFLAAPDVKQIQFCLVETINSQNALQAKVQYS